MKYSTTPDFAQKLAVLATGEEARRDLARLIQTIEAAPDTAGVLAALQRRVHVLDGDVYVVRIGGLRVFLSFGEDFVLLLDVAVAPNRPVPAGTGVPFTAPANAAHNPRINGSINPMVNGSINPRINGSINPRINGSINPRINGSINPRINGSVNPRINGSINPRINGAVNPKLNGAINPRLNPAYPGPYIYDLHLNARGYLVRANNVVDLFFNFDNNFGGTAIRASDTVRATFDVNQDWTGYLVANGQGGYLQFTVDGDWTGFIV